MIRCSLQSYLLAILCLLAVAGFPASSLAATVIPHLKRLPDSAVVSITLPASCRWTPLPAGNGIRIEGVTHASQRKSLAVHRQGLETIEWRPRGNGFVDLYGNPARNLEYRAGRFKDGNQSGLVIHFFYPATVRAGLDQRKTASNARNRGIPIILLDPGHGGMDPGTSHGKLKEKDLTLNFAQRLREKILSRGIAHPVLSRNDDRYLSLAWRRHQAEVLDVDLFLSLHINANTDPRVHGLEIYILSTEESKDEAARRLEGMENLTFMGDERNMLALDDTLAGILIDMQRLNQLRQSSRLAGILKKHSRSGKSWTGKCPVRGARFRVLLNLGAPAALLELGYITHSTDRQNLLNNRRMDELASSSAAAIQEFIQQSPQDAAVTKSNPSSNSQGFRIVRVQSGDTLVKIARRHGTTPKELMRRNDLSNPDQLQPGQALVIPR